MPLERREIVLIGNELVDAVHAFARAEPGVLPPGEITGATVHSEAEPIAISIKLDGADSGAQGSRVYVPRDQCIPILVRYCTEHNIPLPRAGRKNVKILTLPLNTGPTRCLCLSIVLKIEKVI